MSITIQPASTPGGMQGVRAPRRNRVVKSITYEIYIYIFSYDLYTTDHNRVFNIGMKMIYHLKYDEYRIIVYNWYPRYIMLR